MKAFINVVYVRRDLVTIAILRHTCLYIRVEDDTDVIYVKRYFIYSVWQSWEMQADGKPLVRDCHKPFMEDCSIIM